MDGAAGACGPALMRYEPSPLDVARSQTLPGLESDVGLSPLDDEQVERLPVHTSERLLILEPDRYALAVALFFGAGLSHRMVCRLSRLSPHTLTSIIRRESGGQTAEDWRRAMSGDLRALSSMAQAAAADLLGNPDAVRESGLRGVATLLRELTHAHELLAGRMPGQKPPDKSDAESYVESLRRAQGQSIEAQNLVGSGEVAGSASEGDSHA